MTQIEKMFSHEGKTTKLIGKARAKIYEELYNYISDKQTNNEIKLLTQQINQKITNQKFGYL